VDEIIPVIVVITLGAGLLVMLQRQLDQRWEPSWLGFAFLAHLAASFAQVLITRGYYGGGDMVMYHRTGNLLAQLVRADPGRFLPDVFWLVLNRPVRVPFHMVGNGTATGSMSALAACTSLLTNDSIYASALIFSFLSFSGSWALYMVFRETFPASLRQRLVITCMGLPSVVYWTSGILKESVAVAGFGWVLFGTHRMFRGQYRVGGVAALGGAFLMAMVKPYILIAFGVSAGVFFYWRRAIGRSGTFRVRPFYFVLSGSLAVAFLLGLGEVFPRYAISGLADEATRLQVVGARVSGGSNYNLVAAGQSSVLGQIAYAPLALATTLFRPLPFEISGATMAVNAVETTLLTGWLVAVLWRRRWSEIWTLTTRSPLLMFCVSFIVLFGVAVGLASTNLGSLSRYRAPLVPLFASLIAVWGGWRPSPQTAGPAARPLPRRVRRRGRFQRRGA